MSDNGCRPPTLSGVIPMEREMISLVINMPRTIEKAVRLTEYKTRLWIWEHRTVFL
jgi:hypothetical protein